MPGFSNGRNGGTLLARRPEAGVVPLSQVMNQLFQDSFLLPSAFGGPGTVGVPAGTNLWEDGDDFVVQAAMPGMNPETISCSVEQNLLTVKGEAALQIPQNATIHWQSLGGTTQYQIQLPNEVESEQAEATYDAGILTIRLAKAQQARTKTIKVNAR